MFERVVGVSNRVVRPFGNLMRDPKARATANLSTLPIADAAIVMAFALSKDGSLNSPTQSIVRTVSSLHHAGLAPRIFSFGSARDNDKKITEARAMASGLRELDVNERNIIEIENPEDSDLALKGADLQLLGQRLSDFSVSSSYLVAHPLHLWRARLLCEKSSPGVMFYPVEAKRLSDLELYDPESNQLRCRAGIFFIPWNVLAFAEHIMKGKIRVGTIFTTHSPQQLVLDEIREQFKAFATSGEVRRLENARSLIYDSHCLINRKQARVFRVTLDEVAKGRRSVLELYEWLKQNTSMRDCAIRDEWSLAGKGEKGDGAWFKWQREEDRLGPKINRDNHMMRVVLACQDILKGDYQNLYEYAYRNLLTSDLTTARPNLTHGILEKFLPVLSKKHLLPELRKLIYLGMVLHDYGRLLKDKVKADPKDENPLAKQHRVAGAHLAGDLMLKLGFEEFQIEIVKLLIRQHDAVWNCYCLDRYGKERNNFTSPKTIEDDIDLTLATLKSIGRLPVGVSTSELKIMLRKMIAVIGIADVYASGDRYLSDTFIENVILRIK